jgi:hypothetical protein
MFQITGAFAEFERSMIRQRINAGLKRAVEQGKQLGRPRIPAELEKRIQALLRSKKGMLAIAKECRVGTSTVQRIAREMTGANRPFDDGASAAAAGPLHRPSSAPLCTCAPVQHRANDAPRHICLSGPHNVTVFGPRTVARPPRERSRPSSEVKRKSGGEVMNSADSLRTCMLVSPVSVSVLA